MPTINYPASPKADIRSLIKISSGYRKNVLGVLLSILVFILGYLAVLVLSVLLIYFGAKLALAVLTVRAGWLTLLAAAGIMIVVIMFFVFVIKFMFKIKKDDDTHKVEVSREDHPQLFEFVDRVCEETRAQKPRKIMVSSTVNASVYYNSSFLSMFFPVRKNLEIGLGLISSVNVSEFKAVIAHEFGHFSQSSTRLGSYVYRFNRMIHNLLFDNKGWSDSLNSITSLHAILRFFGQITIGMANLVLRFFIQLYKLINISYFSLSREMEFHADSVAVSVTGSKPIISALHRLEFANQAYHYTLQGIVDFNPNEISYPENFFVLFERNIRFLAQLNDLRLEDGLPIIAATDISLTKIEPRIKYKDVWASHPDITDREKNANRIFLESEIIKSSPWELFSNPETLQKKLSRHLVELNVKQNKVRKNEELLHHFETKELENRSNPVYKGFYNNTGNTFAVPKEENKEAVLSLDIKDLFNEAILLKLKAYQQHIHDTELIKNISEGHLDVKRFEFDGKAYTRYYSADIYKQLQRETEEEAAVIRLHIQKISDWFYFRTAQTNPTLAEKYKSLMVLRDKMAKDREPLIQLLNELVTFYHKELAHNRNADDLPNLKEKVSDYYNHYLRIVKNTMDEAVPKVLRETVFPSGYKAAIFNSCISDPGSERNLDGFGPFVNNLEALIENSAKIDFKVYTAVMKTQDEMLN